MIDDSKSKTPKVMVPPDGGYGWIVVFGTAIIGVFHLSFIIIFAFVYGPIIKDVGHGTSGTSLVTNISFLSESLFGLFSAQLIKKTSCRTTAVMGCCFATIGVILTVFSTQLWHIVVAYGIIRGIGISMIVSSCFVIVNSYFTTKRGKAVGISSIGPVLGQVIMIHVASYLIDEYSHRGTILILGGLTMNALIGALLLHPAKWHKKEQKTDENLHVLIMTDVTTSKSDTKIMDCEELLLTRSSETTTVLPSEEKNKKKKRNILSLIATSLDLNLLKDVKFVSVMIGNSLAYASVLNFTVLSPLILKEMLKFDHQTISIVLSISPASDILSRLFLPTIIEKFKISSYSSVMIGCLLLIIARQALIFKQPVGSVIFLMILTSCGRALIMIFEKISVSDTCSPDRVTVALGLHQTIKSFIILPAGYFVGWIRDYSGSFVLSVTVLNVMVLTVIVMWLPPILWDKWKGKGSHNVKLELKI